MKLRTKIILLLLPVTLAVTLVSSIFTGLVEHRDTIRLLDEEGLKIARIVGIGTFEALLSHNLEVIDEYTSTLIDEPEILYISIHDRDNTILGHSDNSLEGQNPEDELALKAYITDKPIIQQSRYKGERCSDYTYPMIKAGRKWGHVRVGLSYERVSSHLYMSWFRIAIIALLTVTITTILAAFIAKVIVSPLEKLSKSAATLDMEPYSPIEEEFTESELSFFSREIRQLYDSLSSMVKRLHKSMRSLKESEKNLSITLNSIGDAVITTDRRGRVTRMNPIAERLTGWTQAEAVERPLSDFFEIVNAQSRERVESPVDRVLETNTITWLTEDTLLISRDKSEYLIADSAAPIIDDEGSSSGVVLVFRDETEKAKSEEQLIQAQKMEAVGTLAGGLAHDFNNMLGGILGPISLIEQKMTMEDSLSNEDLADFVSMIKMSGERASELVKQLLTMSHRHRISMDAADLNSLVKRVVKLAGNTFDRSISIKARYSEFPAMTMADALQIEQALINLTINASHSMTIMRKETEKWGGNLYISLDSFYADSLFIKVHPTLSEGEYWVISIKDSGVGINKTDLPNIFTPFFTTKGKGKGTGLGLSMAYSIIKQHKGSIMVSSERGVGTTFNIYLPGLKREPDSKRVKNQQEEIVKGEGLILVIDDEIVLRDMARMMLEECGYKTVVAEDGKEGLKIFKKQHAEIDGVLLDMVMPRMSGKETYKKMKEIDPDVKVLLSSGYKQDKRISSVLNMGARGFIQKPYDLKALSIAIKKYLF